jgi:type IV pilus assembly protein PilX
MKPTSPCLRRHATAPKHQRGTMLIIALIVLVAMTLAGIAMMRSVDTATIVAGNIAFRQSSINAADQGVQAAYAWLAANTSAAVLKSDRPADGYLSRSPDIEPDWYASSMPTGAITLNGGTPDDAGNVVSYVIHRMCPVADCPAGDICGGVPNVCGSTPGDLATASGEGTEQSEASHFTKPPAIHYRITARAVGPRSSTTVVQTMVRFQ